MVRGFCLFAFKKCVDLASFCSHAALSEVGLAAAATIQCGVQLLDKGTHVTLTGADGVFIVAITSSKDGTPSAAGV